MPDPSNHHDSQLVFRAGGNLDPIQIRPKRLSRSEVNAVLLPVALALLLVELELPDMVYNLYLFDL